jgi:hypothetical protein
MKLVMTLLVRDAEGLLRENLEFHGKQGVDFFIITDNRSVDRTPEIIAEYVRAGVAESIWEPGDDFSQARWVTRMARRAAAVHCADWVINNDQDEFWHGRGVTLRDVLSRVQPHCAALLVERHNHPPVAEMPAEGFYDSMIYRERRSKNIFGQPLPPKVCHRAFSDIEVSEGNHTVSRRARPLAAQPTAAISISHFPIRDFVAFERKIATGGAAYARNSELDPRVGATWRWLYQLWREGRLREWYDRHTLDHDQIMDGLASGRLIEEHCIRRGIGRA